MHWRKLHMIILMSVTAILLSYSYTVQARDLVIYKCQDKNGTVLFQDRPCQTDIQELVVYSEPVQALDAGLRVQERFVLEQIYKRQNIQLWVSQPVCDNDGEKNVCTIQEIDNYFLAQYIAN